MTIPMTIDPFANINERLDGRQNSYVPTISSNMSVEQLLIARQQIDAQLPTTTLNQLDLSHELVIQLQQVKLLQSQAMEDLDTPVNQRAQAANSVASVLVSLAKLQNETYNSERLKKIEMVLLEAIQDLPEDQQERFLQRYEDMLSEGVR